MKNRKILQIVDDFTKYPLRLDYSDIDISKEELDLNVWHQFFAKYLE